MLRLYYTTTKGQEEQQINYFNSLGGYKSANLVANDEFDNIFGEISSYTISNNNENQYIALILKNESVTEKTNINVWFEYPETPYSKLYIAIVDLSEDEDGIKFMENVKSLHSSPLYADFYEVNGELNKALIGNLATNSMVGVWIKRELDLETIQSDLNDMVEVDPEDEHKVVQKTLETSDTIELKFSYD